MDRLTKSAYFLPVSNDDPLDKLAQLYVEEIVRLHGVPISIVSDRTPDSHLDFDQFTGCHGDSIAL